MNETCERIQESMDQLNGPGAAAEEMRTMLDHIESCAACAGHWDLLGRLRDGLGAPDVDDRALGSMRQRVLREIRVAGAAKPSFGDRLRALFATPAFAYGVAALLLVAGLVGGRMSVTSVPAKPASAAVEAGGDNLVRDIRLAANRTTRLDELENSPYVYSNVRVDDAGGGQVRLAFDVSRHVDTVMPKTDPLVAAVLVQSLLDESPVGTRLRAVDYSGSLIDPKVKSALIRAMLGDSNLGVRLRAQSRLVEIGGDAEVQNALLSVLEKEESVQMRLVAIDCLTRHQIDPARIENAVAPEGRARQVDAVYVRAMNYVGSK
jgi:hypothetical protein